MSALVGPTARSGEPAGQMKAVALLSVALVMTMSTWFSASSVIPQLDEVWSLTTAARAWLTIAVQIGFVAGALFSALLNVSDLVRARVVILIGGLGAGVANALLVVVDGPGWGIPLRFFTGFFMAGVYPPAFKLIATWFRANRGTALGILAGSIILGNAMPHLVNGLGGVDWRNVIVVTSLLSAAGGVIALNVREGPFPFPRAEFDPRQIGKVFSNRGVRLASIGYFGHMWELFAMYAWFLVFLSDHLVSIGGSVAPNAALLTFVVIATGSLGCIVGGVMSDRWGRTSTTIVMLSMSGLCSLGIGLAYGTSTWALMAIGILWGFSVVADSAQFSAIVTEVGDQSYVGTALTMQLAIGFTVTVATIWLIPIIEEIVTWRWAFAILALGPVVGVASMLRLRSLPEAADIGGGRG